MNSLDRRRDHRTVEQFEESLRDSTAREGRLALAWRRLLLDNRLASAVEIKDNGIDNTGGLIRDTRGCSGRADFSFYFEGSDLFCDGWHDIELKYVNRIDMCTFKKYDLLSYIKDDVVILLIWGEGFENPKYWDLVGPSQMSRIVEDKSKKGQIRSTYKFMGYKPAMIVPEHEFTIYFPKRREWTS